jgi:capsular exopolysaccharide synthesis family protein
MELEKYFTPLLKWWWLIIAATAIATTASYLATEQQEPVYKSRTTLIVGSPIGSLNPASSDLQLAQYLAGVYADFAKREPFQQATKKALGIDFLPLYTANAIPNSQIIEIIVTANSPEISQIVASELANQLLLQSPSSGVDSQQRQEFVENQLSLLQGQIVDTRTLIEELQKELPTLNSARQIANMQSQIDSLVDDLNTYQTNYANLLSSAPQEATNVLSVLEPAQLGYPDQTNRLIPIFLSAGIGFSLAIGAAYLIEYLDNTLHTEEDIQRIFGVPVLGHIMRMKGETLSTDFITDNPRSPEAEAFRSLRTNINNAIKDQSIQTILISSVNMGDGKSTVISNLAISYAQAEKSVAVIDADMRRPAVHERFNIPQNPGLAEAIEAPKSLAKILSIINKSHISVLTAGSTPPNPAEMLSSTKMDQVLEFLKKDNDFIILDSPPFLVTDAKILASKADGLLLVINPGKVREDIAKQVNIQIEKIGVRLLGVIFNEIPQRDMKKIGEYSYYSSYYQSAE